MPVVDNTKEMEQFAGIEKENKPVEEVKKTFSALEIQELLPHRYPFALVDRIIDYVPGEKAVGLKNLTINESFFQGHIPGRPIMPGFCNWKPWHRWGDSINPTAGDEGEILCLCRDRKSPLP